MKALTEYLTMNVRGKMAFVNITLRVVEAVGLRANAVTTYSLPTAWATISRPVRPVAPITRIFMIGFLQQAHGAISASPPAIRVE